MPNVLGPILAVTTPRLCRDFKPHPTAVADIEISAPNVYEFEPFQQVIGKFSARRLAWASTSARLRFSPQLVESDDVSAVTSVVTAATLSMLQNELIEFCSLLTTNGNLSRWPRMVRHATDANLIEGGGKDLATLSAGIAALAAITTKRQAWKRSAALADRAQHRRADRPRIGRLLGRSERASLRHARSLDWLD